MSGTIVFIVLGLGILPGIAYSLSPQRKTTNSKFNLYLLSVWVSHAVFIVPGFLIAIIGRTIDFWFWTKVDQIFRSTGWYDALIYGYFYFIFYISIFIGPLLIIEKRLNRKISKTGYAFVITWFWIAVYFIQQFLVNITDISRKLFPAGDNDALSQWLLVGFIVLTAITIRFLNKGLWTDIKTSFSSKKK